MMKQNPRRCDLDALRAFAMLMGIVLHGAISFAPGHNVLWGVQDVRASNWFSLLIGSTHGWRMPLFFLVSGFFTTMLWKKRGMAALLKHRSLRILLPLVIGMFTLVPLNWMVSIYVDSHESETNDSTQVASKVTNSMDEAEAEEQDGVDIFEAIIFSNIAEIQRYIDQGGDLNRRDPFGSTPLQVACFYGRSEAAISLMRAGADLDAINDSGETVEWYLAIDWETTSAIASSFQIPINKTDVFNERQKISDVLATEFNRDSEVMTSSGNDSQTIFGVLIFFLFYLPVWLYLWFLYFLCWFVVGFAIIVKLASSLKIPSLPKSLISGWRRYIWLIPLTAVPQFFMTQPMGFGADTSMGFLPLPAVLAYYAIFFAYGALYFTSDDERVEVGQLWWLKLLIGLVVIFPLGVMLIEPKGFLDRVLFSVVQVSYTWLMCFGFLGLFHRCFSTSRAWIRYVSDASYWMYLVHVPVLILCQYWVSRWDDPAILKFTFVCTFTTVVLMASYQTFVRWTYIGLLLNGRMVPWRKSD